MELNSYQDAARKTAAYPDVGRNPIYPTLGLTGEAGEEADKVKKVIATVAVCLTPTPAKRSSWSWEMCSGTWLSWPANWVMT